MTVSRHWKPASGDQRNFTAQAGRSDKTKIEDEPWGTTSSQSHFKAYEASEARNARSTPVRPIVESAAGPGPRPLQIWERHREDYPALSAASGETGGGSKYIPAAELVQMRPIPDRSFGSVSHYTQHQEDAQKARHDYFPYRDEFHPRSKRLLHEMALNAVSQSLERSGSVASDDTRSVFTLPSTAASRKAASKASSANQSLRSRSLSSSRLPTGDSLRVGGGQPGMLAKRRAQAFFRSPSQSKFDRDWCLGVLEREGPAPLTSTNYTARMYNGSLDKYGQALAEMSALLGGERETQPRERTNK